MTQALVDTDVLRLWMVGTFSRIEKAEGRPFVIGGYANVSLEDEDGKEVPDLQNESVDVDALDEAFTRMMVRPSRRNLNAYHTNAQIGEILEKYTDSDGITWKSHTVRVPTAQYIRKGLFIVAEIFNDTLQALRYMGQMVKGKMLGFSIGGEAIRSVQVCNTTGDCFDKITFMDLFEVSACEHGVNQESRARVMKGIHTHPLLDDVNSGAELLRKLRGK